MDAQNAAESDQTKPAGASPRTNSRSLLLNDKPILRPGSPTREVNPTAADDPDAPEDRDSDAETVVLPGKDGYSPSKVRKVRQEDKSDGDGDEDGEASKTRGQPTPRNRDFENGDRSAHTSSRPGGHDDFKSKDKDRRRRNKDGSSGLSSAPTSPHRHRRRSINSRRSSLSESDHNRQRPSKSSLRDKLKPGERLLPHKRKAPKTESDDEENARKVRRQRTSSAGFDAARSSGNNKFNGSKYDNRNRSVSPPPRSHRRSISTQLQSNTSNGPGPKKKRVPPPLQSTEYDSDESSTGDSPRPRHTKLRNLATPAASEPMISPAKMPSHKKHLDAHGQTYLARACARGEYDSAKTRLADRPEDLNVADYAGNTPLQIAALNGVEEIVKLLIDAGCNLDCVNYDKDTPLLDAVDNGHLGVVTLLLDAGVNPRKANMHGEEPIDRVNEDTDNAEEIRAALTEAKKRFGGRTKTSEDRMDCHDGRDSHAPDSPRHRSPAVAVSRRGGTVRSTKTRNDLLYMPLDDKTLRQAARSGDEETVARILQVKDGCDDSESMVAAARGGHDLVIQLLLGLGGAHPDPEPVSSVPEEFATPILAAIGQENIKVLELLLEQQSFDPTRRFKGEAYYEIARRRQGVNWKEEEDLLKKAYDSYKNPRQKKTKSPGRRDREEKRSRREDKSEGRSHQRSNSSPSRENEPRRKSSMSKISSPKEKRRPESHANFSEEGLQKRGGARHRKEDRISTVNISDREVSPTLSHKPAKTKRAESDLAAISSEGETVKPRRKLVSKGELRGEREKQRRSSMASNASSLKEPQSPREPRIEDTVDKNKLSERYHDRTKALKRDESRDRRAESGDGITKRHRSSLTPDRHSNGDKDNGEAPIKRRRLEGESSEKRQNRPSSPEGQPRKTTNDTGKLPSKSGQKKESGDINKPLKDTHRKELRRPTDYEPSVHIKSEDADVEMPDLDSRKGTDDANTQSLRERKDEEEKKKATKKAKEDEERKRLEAEQKKTLYHEAEEARKRKEEEEAKKNKEEYLEAERRRKEEVHRRKRVEEESRLAEEKARQEAEERIRREADETKRLEEQKQKQEEEERKRREEEEERHRKERKAAEEARIHREEEERQERERRERAHREEIERKRAAREAEQTRMREEQDKARLEKLPPLLRWLDCCPNPKKSVFADKFKTIQGVRYDCIRPEANNTPEGRDQWILNTHAALLLGEKDLGLSPCRFQNLKRPIVNELRISQTLGSAYRYLLSRN